MSLAAVSKHIRVLEDAGLVRRTIVGREHRLTLEPAPLSVAAGWLVDPGVIEIHRRLPATIGEVFRWWTDPDLLRQWMTPIGTVEADVDLRVGGGLCIVEKGDGRAIEHRGE